MLEKVVPISRVATPVDSRLTVPAMGRDEAIASSLNLAVVFWRRRWVILLSIVICLCAAFLYLRRAVPMYASSSVLYVHQTAPKVITEAVVNNEVANLFTQCELIKSTATINTAMKSPEVAKTKLLRNAENPSGLLKSLLTAEPQKQGDLLQISIITGDPVDASTIVNAMVQAYIDLNNTQQAHSVSEVIKVLQLDKVRSEEELVKTSDDIVKFKQENPEMALVTKSGNLVTDRYALSSDALTKAEFETRTLQSQNEELAILSNDPLELREYINTIQGQEKNEANRQPSAAQVRLSYLLTREQELKPGLGAKNPAGIAMEEEISKLTQEIQAEQQKELGNFMAISALNLKIAKMREEQLRSDVEKERGAFIKLNNSSARLVQLLDNQERQSQKLANLDGRIKELLVTEEAGGTGGLSVTILETAKPNFSPVSPKPAQSMAIGLIVGVMMGLSGALLQDFLDQRLRSAEEISRVLDLPILGTVPHMNSKSPSSERGQEVHLRTRSDVSEAYRTIRTAIYFGVAEDRGRTILITSPAPGDGKSTMASNLAIAMAQAGRRVLLIDADCRRPTQHKIFGIKPETGLCAVLLRRSKFEDAVHHTSIQNLDFLPCGPLPGNPSELLDSQALIDLLKLTSGKYDNVLIDTAPVVPVTDARILSASCDVTLLVLRAEKSTKSMTQHAVDALSSVGANVLGVLVNDVPRGQAGAYYYYYGGYGYKYGYASHVTPQTKNGKSKEVKAITVATKSLQA